MKKMKEIFKSTLIYFFIGATFTGSVYKLINNFEQESIVKLMLINVTILIIAFLFSFFGFKFKKNVG